MNNSISGLVLVGMVFVGTGCATKPPTIAHVHIGHTLTGWTTTPNKEGLLVTAEQESRIVNERAKQAAAAGNDLAAVKSSVRDMMHALDPKTVPGAEAGLGFGLLPAVEESISHLEFAAESDDATANVRRSVGSMTAKSQAIVDRCHEVRVFGNAIIKSGSAEESAVLAQEVAALTEQIADGSATGSYGLVQLRRDIEAMVEREDPPYTTIATWYLLNLVRLPSGNWEFQSSRPGGGRGGAGY